MLQVQCGSRQVTQTQGEDHGVRGAQLVDDPYRQRGLSDVGLPRDDQRAAGPPGSLDGRAQRVRCIVTLELKRCASRRDGRSCLVPEPLTQTVEHLPRRLLRAEPLQRMSAQVPTQHPPGDPATPGRVRAGELAKTGEDAICRRSRAISHRTLKRRDSRGPVRGARALQAQDSHLERRQPTPGQLIDSHRSQSRLSGQRLRHQITQMLQAALSRSVQRCRPGDSLGKRRRVGHRTSQRGKLAHLLKHPTRLRNSQRQRPTPRRHFGPVLGHNLQESPDQRDGLRVLRGQLGVATYTDRRAMGHTGRVDPLQNDVIDRTHITRLQPDRPQGNPVTELDRRIADKQRREQGRHILVLEGHSPATS